MIRQVLRDIQLGSGVSEAELTNPTFITLFRVVWHSLRAFRMERAAGIVGSAFFLLMLWGYHGNLDLLKLVVPTWSAPGENISGRSSILPFVPWDRELISFWRRAARRCHPNLADQVCV